jgi:hypothetical protein
LASSDGLSAIVMARVLLWMPISIPDAIACRRSTLNRRGSQ